MTTFISLLLGGSLGAALIMLATSLRSQPVPLAQVFETLDGPAGVSASGDLSANDAQPLRERLGGIAATLTGQSDEVIRNLAIVDQSLEQHALAKVAGPALAAIGTYLCWTLLLTVGVPIPPLWATLFALCAAAVFFVLPDARLRVRAQERRIEFRHALSAYLDLVTIILAGGGGITTSLQTAANAGGGWAFEETRHSLDYARFSNRAPWAEFAAIAKKFDVTELGDLAASADLAGGEGSKIADSIATKAAVLRSRLSSEVETQAEALTERMVIPVFGLLAAVFLFIGFGVASELLSPSTIDPPPSALIANDS